jgi:hypothetical protein
MFHESGTGNGMAKSVSNLSGEPCDAATATFAIIQGMYTIPSFQDIPPHVHHVWIFLNKTASVFWEPGRTISDVQMEHIFLQTKSVLLQLGFTYSMTFCYCIYWLTGHKQALDVATVAQGKVKYHSILMLSWGMSKNTSNWN